MTPFRTTVWTGLACLMIASAGCGGASQNAQQASKPKIEAPAEAKITEHTTVTVTEARLVHLEATDASLETRWEPVAGLIGPQYQAWQGKGPMKQHVSANGITGKSWQFVRVVLVLKHDGTGKETVPLCPAKGECPNISMADASGAAVPLWEFITAGWYPKVTDFQADMKSHAEGVLRRTQFEGNIFVELDAGQQTWLAVLFDAQTNPIQGTLKAFGKPIPISIKS